ncbi:hypothetical protein YH64_009130 [Achromobacter sp. LC458]|uniref:hypothetical protein n=1 Tax=Achromobacter sp. LC458 TaxID=1120623 RepID=UPI000629FA06|nr:hypothetical protein [Achromobacter sp. LC458]TRM53253.1 hypothetical protein YH64_009130 [Achromobacter sp. LC458]
MGDIEQIRDLTRQRWGRITAFRLGQIAAEYMGPLAASANPYKPGQHAHRNYLEGVSFHDAKAAQPTTKESHD